MSEKTIELEDLKKEREAIGAELQRLQNEIGQLQQNLNQDNQLLNANSGAYQMLNGLIYKIDPEDEIAARSLGKEEPQDAEPQTEKPKKVPKKIPKKKDEVVEVDPEEL